MTKKDQPDQYPLKPDAMLADSMLLKYQGAVTSEVIDSLLSLVQHRLESSESDVGVHKKVYSVFMECIQNIRLHVSHQKDVNYETGFISLERLPDKYEIIAANFVATESTTALVDKIEKINSKGSPEELRKFYNEVIVNRIFGANGGGGLGLIDIARKTTGKLNYSLDKVNEDYSFFTLKATVKR